MNHIISLYYLPVNTIGTIEHLDCIGSIQRRLLDLGMIKGSKIIPLFKSPAGDPIAYSIRGSVIALRKEDALNIKVLV